MLQTTDRGLYCALGDFYIDPWAPVERAVITHAHSDHARWGMGKYLTAARGVPVLRERVAPDASIQGIPWGDTIDLSGVRVSFHPAGHILGSAQVRVESRGEVWVVTGDYKTESDPTCDPFELVPCHWFATESTFGLPIFRWQPQNEVFLEIDAWWRANQQKGRTSILFGYALGKAQRLLAGIDATIGPIAVHGAVKRFVDVYRAAGIKLPDVKYAAEEGAALVKGQGLVVAPPSAANTPWIRKFGDVSTAFVSGWMQVRGIRRRRAADRGFTLSDHADWASLLETIKATGAETVAVTHGYVSQLARYLQEQGTNATHLETRFTEETDEEEKGE